VPALDSLKLPARRDVKGLGTVLSEIEAPTPMKATFVEDRYGTFVVVGDAVLSASARTLTMAGRFIEQGMKPDRTLRLLAPVTADSSTDDDVVVPASDTNELRATVASVHHGDIVRAGFHVRTYGSFTITGMAVWSDVAGAFLVGGWYVSAAQEQPAPLLESLQVLATAAEHGAPVPPLITGTLGEDDLGA
jgi:hypothetical protein